jgi:hypothetical protein
MPPQVTCIGAGGCVPGQICCAAGEGTACDEGSCPPAEDTLPAIQLCMTSAECVERAAVCLPWQAAPLFTVTALKTTDAGVCAITGLLDGSGDAPLDGAEDGGNAEAGHSADAPEGEEGPPDGH